jgi:hypothetical protein
MRELVLTCAITLLGAGCVEVIPHRDEFDAGIDVATMTDGSGEPEVMAGNCFSGRRWTGGKGTAFMNPGVPCMGPGCHSPTSKSPIEPMTMAGTIYSYMGPNNDNHDVNDCNGIDGAGIAIAVWNEENTMEVTTRIQVNAVGNFYTAKPLPPVYRVRVLQGGREAIMNTPVNGAMGGGDCNFCHQAVDYMGAKGRIVPKAP